MDRLPLVTIITPTYNHAPFLDETIQSVLSQEYPRIEYIVLDDGSKDNTREVLTKYGGRIYWESHDNMGEAKTVNKGFQLAKGDIICIVNADDPLLPGAVSTAVSFMEERPEILVAYPDWYYISDDSRPLGLVEVPEYDYLFMIANHRCIVGPGAFIRRRAVEITGGRDTQFKYVGDFDFWLRLGLHGPFARIPKPLATFRVHPSSASVAMQSSQMAEEDIRLIKKILSIPALRAYSRRLKLKALSNAHLHASRVSGKAFLTRATHYAQYVLYYPPNLVRDGNGVKASASVCFGSARIFLSHMVSSFLHAFERMRTKKCKENLGKSGQDLEDLAQLIYQVATTGTGSDKCLEYGCLPLPVNFYSPVPDLRDLEQRGIWDRRSPLSGIDFRQEEQARFLSDLGKVYGRECRWPRQKTTDRVQFHTENDCFGFGCAAALHCMIRHLKPARIVEIGSGNSSLVVSAALGRNAEENPLASCDYTIIDPFPNETISEGMLPRLTRLISQRVEVAGDFFADLRQNDILFVDSSHTIRAGGDVNYLILDILPSLAPGVVIHFHDIDLPYEYPKVYFTNPKFRVFWTEAYLLQAFLACNDHFEILLAMRYLMKEREDEFKKAFPFFSEHSDMPSSGSFWIRRK